MTRTRHPVAMPRVSRARRLVGPALAGLLLAAAGCGPAAAQSSDVADRPEPWVEGLTRPAGPVFRAPRDIVRIPGVAETSDPETAPSPGPMPDPGAAETPRSTARAAAPGTPPPSVPATALPVPPPPSPDPDSFAPQKGGFVLYTNALHGTFIAYPSPFFAADPAPPSAAGRRFASADRTAEFTVFAVPNASGASAEAQMRADLGALALTQVDRAEARPGLYVVAGRRGATAVYRRAIVAGADGLIQVFEMHYPADRAAEFRALVDHMAGSFGPGFSVEAGWNDPAPTAPGPVYAPEPGSPERMALLKAARAAFAAQLGRPFRMKVHVVRTDGRWAYVEVTPLAPDRKHRFDWSATPYAEGIRRGLSSDILMALLMHDGSGWTVVDSVIGPTDVAWLGWVQDHGLPEALFQP